MLDLVKETIPGNIRKAEHFVTFLKKFVIFVRGLINIKDVKILSPETFLEELNKSTHLEPTPLKYNYPAFSNVMAAIDSLTND